MVLTETNATALPALISAAISSAHKAAVADGEVVTAHRVIQHNAGHIIVWLDCEAGKQARFAVWDGSSLVNPLTISDKARTRASLRALKVHETGTLIQDWAEAA